MSRSFDDLAKALAMPMPRRRTFAIIASALAAAAVPGLIRPRRSGASHCGECPGTTVCCDQGGSAAICCEPGLCCFDRCCNPGHFCYFGADPIHAHACCASNEDPCGDDWRVTHCCPPGQQCCLGQPAGGGVIGECCPAGRCAGSSDPAHGGSICCPPERAVCSGICCGPGEVCDPTFGVCTEVCPETLRCGSECIPPGAFCCDPDRGLWCPAGVTCCNAGPEGVCCEPGFKCVPSRQFVPGQPLPPRVCCPSERACRGECCGPGQVCVADLICCAAEAACHEDRSWCCEPGVCCGVNKCCPSRDLGFACCNDFCTDIWFNRFSCGACGRACQAEELCVRGECVPAQGRAIGALITKD